MPEEREDSMPQGARPPEESAGAEGEGRPSDTLRERSRVIRESREASLRAEGGGSSDEQDIARASREEEIGG